MSPCRCALRDKEGNVTLPRTGYVKYYVTKDAPGLPGWLQTASGGGIRWLSATEGYYLCLCPDCATVAGKRRTREERAA